MREEDKLQLFLIELYIKRKLDNLFSKYNKAKGYERVSLSRKIEKLKRKINKITGEY